MTRLGSDVISKKSIPRPKRNNSPRIVISPQKQIELKHKKEVADRLREGREARLEAEKSRELSNLNLEEERLQRNITNDHGSTMRPVYEAHLERVRKQKKQLGDSGYS